MDQPKKDWLKDLSDRAVARTALDARREQKEAVLAKLSRDMGDNLMRLFGDMNLKVSDGKKEQNVLSYGKRDQTEEFDLDEMQDGYSLMNDADLARHLDAARIVTGFAAELEVEVDELDEEGKPTGKKVPLFDKSELASELYQPLVRQGLMAETFVPDEFSQTREMIDGSFEAYQERLKKEKTGPKMRFVKENFALFKSGVMLGSTVTTSVTAIDGAANLKPSDARMQWGDFTDGKGLDRIKEIGEKIGKGDANSISEATGIGLDLIFKGKEGYEDWTGREKGEMTEEEAKALPTRVKLAPKTSQLALAAIAGELGSGLSDLGLGMSVSSAFGAVVKSAGLSKALAAKTLKEADVLKAAQDIADGFATALLACDPKAGTSTKTLTDAAAAMKGPFLGVIKPNEIVAELSKDDNDINPSVIIDMFARAGAAAATAAKTPELLQLAQDEDQQQKMKEKADELMTEEFKKDVKAAEEESKKELDDIENEQDNAIRAGLLEKRIKKLARDQALIKWAFGIGSLGFDLASKAIGPLAIAGCAVRIAQNLMEAIKRTRDMVNWCREQRDMLLAASPYSSPLANFIDNAALQAIHYEINVAIEVIKMIGAICESTGIPQAVAAGKAVQATASAMGALEAFLYECKKRYNLEQAWITYKRAILRPDNRKLALIAMKKNPTLAKYAVAWGAIIKKDGLVADFMGTCGLDERTLSDPNANLDRVVKYLELRMPDDNVVVGRSYGLSDWAPSKIEITLSCWAGAKKKAELKADLIPEPTRGIDSAIARAESLWKTIEPKGKGGTATVAEIAELKAALNELSSELGGYAPKRLVDKKPLEHRDMLDVVGEFRKSVDDQLKTADTWVGV